MTIEEFIKKQCPLDKPEKIDFIMNELGKYPGALSKNTYNLLMNYILKDKLKIKLIKKETVFCQSPADVDITDVSMPVVNKPQVVTQPFVQPPLGIELPKESLGSMRHIYGNYIEMAFHNFFVNMRHIYRMVFGDDIMDQTSAEDFANEKRVWNPMFDRFFKANPDEYQKTVELIYRHFPFLQAANDYVAGSKNFKDYDIFDVLYNFYHTIQVLRNVYSHYAIELYPNQKEDYNNNEEFIAGVLKREFLKSKRVVKERFNFSSYQMECAEWCDEKTRKAKPDYKYDITVKGTNHLTVFGIVMLASLFLEKKYSKIFSDKVRCIPLKDQSVINELIAVDRLRLHRQKLYVTKNTDALAFDILTELRRCPMELFELMRPNDQLKFRVKSKDEEIDNVLMVRKQDRFPHLVLKYIDDAHLFQNIRFQVSLGRYFYKFYNKRCIDATEASRVRALCKDVHGFGRITEIETMRKELWGDMIRDYDEMHKNTADEKPYITDHHAQYIISSNRIGMYLSNGETDSYLPELTPDGAKNLAPTCFMSIYELPAMMFLMHLAGADTVENIIKEVIANRSRLYADIAEGRLLPMANESELATLLKSDYGVACLADIPVEMVDYLTGKTPDSKAKYQRIASGLIDSLIAQTEYKQRRMKEKEERIASKLNKIGKKGYEVIKTGTLASFLAKDIMYFQPHGPKGEGKLTGLNFRVLQSVLAQFGSRNVDTEYLKRTLTSAHIIGKPGDDSCNPIVMRVWRQNPTNTKDFYKLYLTERLAFLKECKRSGAKDLYFFHSDRACWQVRDEDFYKAKAARYLHEESNGAEYNKSLELPRGIFDSEIRNLLSGNALMNKDATDKTKNINYLIYGYHKKMMQDDYQTFYEKERTYRLLDLLFRSDPKAASVFYDGKQLRQILMKNKLRKEIAAHLVGVPVNERETEKAKLNGLFCAMKNNENLLKRYRIQDIILFTIAMTILMNDDKDQGRLLALDRIRLKDIGEKDDLLSQKINYQVTVESKNGYKKRVYQDDLKLKDYDRFYRFLSDRRMPSLLDLVQETSIARTDLEKELDKYDQEHPNILDKVFSYERMYLSLNSPQTPKDYEFSKMIKNDSYYNSAGSDGSHLIQIRNSFAHCSYPKYGVIKDEVEKRKNAGNDDFKLPKKAQVISEYFEQKIKKK